MMLADGSLRDGLLLVAGVLALTFFSLNLTRRTRRRMRVTENETRRQLERLRAAVRETPGMGAGVAADQQMIALEEFARRVNAQFDTKFAKLEAVVRDADERITRLEALLTRVEQAGGVGAARHAAGVSASPSQDAASSSQHTVSSSQDPVVASAHDAESADQSAAGPPPADCRRVEVADEQRRQVYALADEGRPLIQIAEKLGLPLGEVELILNLRALG